MVNTTRKTAYGIMEDHSVTPESFPDANPGQNVLSQGTGTCREPRALSQSMNGRNIGTYTLPSLFERKRVHRNIFSLLPKGCNIYEKEQKIHIHTLFQYD